MNRYGSYLLGIVVLLLTTIMTPAFAEVASLQTNKESFYKGDEINFSGTVEKDSTGLVTIVIRDLNDEFVMLEQAIINPDDTFEKSIKISDKFSKHGVYNATGFIFNMTEGITTNFGVSLNGIPITSNENEIKNEVEIKPAEEEQTKDSVTKEIVVEEIQKEPEPETTTKIADFVDGEKDPQYYLDRYYNELSYKSWFDRNYPGLTIEEAVGYIENDVDVQSNIQEIMDKEIIPEAQAISTVEPVQQSSNPEVAQIILAVVGLGILFGAVYGVKRQVDDNSKQISINRETLRKKIIRPIMGTNPKDILQTRLAKGEISLEEYEKIKSKMD